MGKAKNKGKVETPKNEAPKVEAKGFFVADDKCINCRRGVLTPGTQVFPKDFPGGEATIREHISFGGIVEK